LHLTPLNNQTPPPLLVVGTKLDQAQLVRTSVSLQRSSSSYLAAEYRTDEINLVWFLFYFVFYFKMKIQLRTKLKINLKDCMQPKYLASGSTNSIKLAKFFDKVIKYYLKINKKK
jgi:Rab-like protein 3